MGEEWVSRSVLQILLCSGDKPEADPVPWEPRVPSPEHRCTRGLSALHCSSSAPSGSRGALCRSEERQALPEAPVALVTDELDSPLSPGD